MSQQHTITALVQNEAGTINRLVSMFRRRGVSLASFNAGDCEQEGYSRLTLVVDGDESILNQTVRQLYKLIDVVEVEDLRTDHGIHRELALIRVDPGASQLERAQQVASEFEAKVPSVTETSVFVEFTGDPKQIEALIGALKPYNVAEVVRTGVVAMRTEPARTA